MRRLLLWLVLIAALSAAAVMLADQPGLMKFEWMGWRVTLNTSLFIALMLGLLLVIAWLSGSITQLRAWPERRRTHRALLRQQAGLKALTRAAAALAVSDTDYAKKDIAKARRYLDDAPLALLMQAQLHEKQGESGKAAGIYHELSAYEETARLGLRGLLQSAEKNRDFARALVIATEGIALFPHDTALLVHTLELMLREGELVQAEELLGRWRVRWRLPRDQRQLVESLVLLLKSEDADPSEAVRMLARAHALAPRQRYIGLSYLRAMLAAGDAKFRKVLHAEWYDFPSPELTSIALSWLAQLPEVKREKAAAKLAKRAADHLESYLLLAYDAQSRDELVIARQHAEEALAIRESRRALQLIADIEAETGGLERAQPWYGRAAAAPTEELWVCGACGHGQAQWLLFCPACDACDSMELALPNQTVMQIEQI